MSVIDLFKDRLQLSNGKKSMILKNVMVSDYTSYKCWVYRTYATSWELVNTVNLVEPTTTKSKPLELSVHTIGG